MKRTNKKIHGGGWIVSCSREFLCSDLSCIEYRVYMVIWSHADRNTGIAYPGMRTIVSESKASMQSVVNAIETLETKGLLSVSRTKKDNYSRAVNVYKCNADPATWKESSFESLEEISKEARIEKALQILEELSKDMTDEQRKKAIESITGK